MRMDPIARAQTRAQIADRATSQAVIKASLRGRIAARARWEVDRGSGKRRRKLRDAIREHGPMSSDALAELLNVSKRWVLRNAPGALKGKLALRAYDMPARFQRHQNGVILHRAFTVALPTRIWYLPGQRVEIEEDDDGVSWKEFRQKLDAAAVRIEREARQAR